MERGRLNGGHTALTAKTFAQCWSLDATGNWMKYLEDTNGDGTWDLNQVRTANTVNEITDITETAGASWVTPVYSRAGNMTTMPQPAAPASSYTATYDAWNRLVKIADGANTVSEYQYDGTKRRVVQKSYVSGTPSETRHLYYTEPSKWQVVEERVGSSTDANLQFVWGQRYVDDLILRDRDTDGNGTLNEQLYSLQDANWNVSGILNTSGAIQQRFVYTAYGLPVFLNSSFTAASNTAAWEVLYAGYRFEAGTRLYHVRHRVLNSLPGTWIQRDPLLYADGLSLYQYCNNSPLDLTDPTGELSPPVIGCLTGLAAGTLGSLISDLWANKLEICHSTAQAAFSGIMGCLAGAILANLTTSSLVLMDALRALGLTGMATSLWLCPSFRKALAAAGGIGIGALMGLASAFADCVCDDC